MARERDTRTVLRVSDLPARQPAAFDLRPDTGEMSAIAGDLGLSGLRKLRFRGTLAPAGAGAWLLRADLGATVTQPCVITLAPVTTRIDEEVTRRFSPEAQDEAPGAETEMPQDDTIEPLGKEIDLWRVMTEALALALPAWPRAEGAELGTLQVAADGVAPLTDDETRPFAGLRSLRDRLLDDD